MKYSVNWLNELAGTQLLPKEMAELFTRYSFEVDSLEESSSISQGVVAGKILEVAPHPNADKLSLTKVTIDPEEKEILNIVCGAKNIAPGDVVPVATVGTTLPNGMTIKESAIRGETSHGMLCAEDELGLGEDHSGIAHLDPKTPLGTPFSNIIGTGDAMLELSILSSRGHDALAHIGIAREICAIQNTNLNFSSKEYSTVKSENVEIEVKEQCSRYMGVRLTNVQNGHSPKWMQERLLLCGMRSVNAVVDITNYVMLETGQPLHAFDVRQIVASDDQEGVDDLQIHIRNAREGEKMTLLDESEIELSEEDIVIANTEKPLALAGIMGGRDSGTDESTADVFLEVACFDAMSIRRSRVRHKMNTESSYRFERDIDPNMVSIGASRAVELLQTLCGATIVSSVDVYPKPVTSWTIDLKVSYVEKLLGESISKETIASILGSLGMQIESMGDQQEIGGSERFDLRVTIPTFRRDLYTQEDLIEEIGRLYGYDRIVPVAPLVSLESPAVNMRRVFERKIKDELTAVGCDEILSYSFYRAEVAETFGLPKEKHFTLQNPMNPDQQLFRMNMLPNALEKLKENLRYFDEVRFFEVGKVYEKGEVGKVHGSKAIVALESGGDEVFACLKGRIEAMFASLGMKGVSYQKLDVRDAYFHKTRSAQIITRGKCIARIGEISPFILREMKVKRRVALFEANLSELYGTMPSTQKYAPLPKFPYVWRDMSLVVPKAISAAEVLSVIQRSVGKFLKGSELFDVYEKDGEKSFAYHLVFGDDTRTLTKDEVEGMFQECLKQLDTLGVELKM